MNYFYTYYIPVWMLVVNPHVLDVAGESLVEPQIVPPFHRHQITKPLKQQAKVNVYRRKSLTTFC